MKTVYTAEVIAQGGRAGMVESEHGKLKYQLALPPEMGGPVNSGATNPEQLFGAAYAACFHGAILHAAERAHIKLVGSTVTAVIHLKENDAGAYELGVELRASMPGLNRDHAGKLLHQAHSTCPYSKAVRNNIDVQLTLD